MIQEHETLLPLFMGEVLKRSVGDGGIHFTLSQYENSPPIERQEAPTSPINGGRKEHYDQD